MTIIIEEEEEESSTAPYPQAYVKNKVSETRGKALDEAKAQINGTKADQYGNPEDCFDGIASRWSHVLSKRVNLDVKLSGADVMFLMMELKMERELAHHKRDNIVDLCGYAGLYADRHPNSE